MQNFAEKLIDWYQQNKRNLPWRNTSNPYKIWLSEIILQQTRVQQGLPYYLKFVEKYPEIDALAKASENEVLRLWQGLGYYSRARNMHATAKMIVREFDSVFPNNYKTIVQLKGVGKYTAAAIASFAYDEKVAPVDGNVYRVLSRVFGLATDIASDKGQKEFTMLAENLLPKKFSATYNQAIMEFGALYCKPSNPDCKNCLFSENCDAKLTKRQSFLPYKSKKIKVKKRFFYYLVFEFENTFLLKKRKNKDIWKGLFDFNLIENSKQLSNKDVLLTIKQSFLIHKEFTIINISELYKHKLTHQHLFVTFYHIKLKNKKSFEKYKNDYTLSSFDVQELDQLPKPILVNNYLKEFIF